MIAIISYHRLYTVCAGMFTHANPGTLSHGKL